MFRFTFIENEDKINESPRKSSSIKEKNGECNSDADTDDNSSIYSSATTNTNNHSKGSKNHVVVKKKSLTNNNSIKEAN